MERKIQSSALPFVFLISSSVSFGVFGGLYFINVAFP